MNARVVWVGLQQSPPPPFASLAALAALRLLPSLLPFNKGGGAASPTPTPVATGRARGPSMRAWSASIIGTGCGGVHVELPRAPHRDPCQSLEEAIYVDLSILYSPSPSPSLELCGGGDTRACEWGEEGEDLSTHHPGQLHVQLETGWESGVLLTQYPQSEDAPIPSKLLVLPTLPVPYLHGQVRFGYEGA